MKLDQFDLKKPLLAPPLPPYHCVNLHDHWTITLYQIVIYLEVQPPFLREAKAKPPQASGAPAADAPPAAAEAAAPAPAAAEGAAPARQRSRK